MACGEWRVEINMNNNTGVYTARKKDGTIYYRSSVTFMNKHISLGSFDSFDIANKVYNESKFILYDLNISIDDYDGSTYSISFKKWVSLINFRDNKIYFKTPIYLKSRYFIYYISPDEEYKFDIEDLFYYSSKTIMKRDGHLFVNDYGIQTNILSRYGIKNYAVIGKDYYFKNNDSTDFRYENIIIINPYNGVEQVVKNGKKYYQVKIHINGYYTIGLYNDEETAAIAYNKAVDYAIQYGINKNFQTNYILELSTEEYKTIYSSTCISEKYIEYLKSLPL